MRKLLTVLFILAPFLVHGQVISRTELRGTNNLIRAQTIASSGGIGTDTTLRGNTFATNIVGRFFYARASGQFSFNDSFFEISHDGTMSVLNSASSGSGTTTPISFRTDGIEAIHVAIDQKVGIGTNGPQSPLHVAGDGTAGVPQLRVDALGANSQGIFTIAGRAAGAEKKWTLASRGGLDAPNNRFAFLDQGNTERFTVLEDGKVGIGTINPLASVGISNSVAAQVGISYDTIGTGLVLDFRVGTARTPVFQLTTNGVLSLGVKAIGGGGEFQINDDSGNGPYRVMKIFNRDLNIGSTNGQDNLVFWAKEIVVTDPKPMIFDGETLSGPNLLFYSVTATGAVSGSSAAFTGPVGGRVFTGSSFTSTGGPPATFISLGTNDLSAMGWSLHEDAFGTNYFKVNWGVGSATGDALVEHSRTVFGTTNFIVLTNKAVAAGSGSLATNANQFGANTTLNIKSASLQTNNNFYGQTNWGPAVFIASNSPASTNLDFAATDVITNFIPIGTTAIAFTVSNLGPNRIVQAYVINRTNDVDVGFNAVINGYPELPSIVASNSTTLYIISTMDGKTNLTVGFSQLRYRPSTNDFVLNAYNTNNSTRMALIYATIAMTNVLAGDVSRVALYLDNDGDGSWEKTGIECRLNGVALMAGAEELSAGIMPGGRWIFTNLSAGVTPSAIIQANSSLLVRP